jgi:CTP:molybdopterin cytidylyltransferase MocA
LAEVDGKGGHPLIVPPGLISEIARIPAGHGLNRLLIEHAEAVVRHAWADRRLLADIDTPESYRRHRPVADVGRRD